MANLKPQVTEAGKAKNAQFPSHGAEVLSKQKDLLPRDDQYATSSKTWASSDRTYMCGSSLREARKRLWSFNTKAEHLVLPQQLSRSL